jgi:hypothetical protein
VTSMHLSFDYWVGACLPPCFVFIECDLNMSYVLVYDMGYGN